MLPLFRYLPKFIQKAPDQGLFVLEVPPEEVFLKNKGCLEADKRRNVVDISSVP